jgi:hypothetical protein
VLPGVGCATWLERRGGRVTLLRWPLGFACSMALFGAVAWPFLWYRRTLAELTSVLWPLWCGYALLGLYAALRAPRAAAVDPPADVDDAHAPPEPPTTPPPLRLLAVYFALVAAVAWTIWGTVRIFDRAPFARLAFAAALGALALELAGIVVLLGRARRATPRLPVESDADHWAPPRAWVLAAASLVVLSAASATVYSRPDWDDCYYLAAALDFERAPVLNAEEPTHREGLRVQPHQRLLLWELLGAVLCRISGLSVMELFHTVWPPLLVLLAYAAYAGLFAELVSRRWVPIAIIGLSAIMLCGISGQWSATNFFLARSWQGKSIALHLAVPLASTVALRIARRPRAHDAVALLVAVGLGLTASTSAIFLLLALLASLGLSIAWTERAVSAPLVAIFAVAALPLVAAGLALRASTGGSGDIFFRPHELDTWFKQLFHNTGHSGPLEACFVLAFPWIARVTRERRARAYLVALPIFLLLGVANPLLFHPVARGLTSYETYYRLFWIFPVWTALAALLALLVRWQVLTSTGGRGFLLAAVGALGVLALPTLCVWGPRNTFIGTLGTPHLAENAAKMPTALATFGARLAAQPDAHTTRILCDEQVASFLTPFSRDLRFVQTRALYTPRMLVREGSAVEGLERHLLGRALTEPDAPRGDASDFELLLRDVGDGEEAGPFRRAIAEVDRDVERLLRRYRVGWAVTIADDRGAGMLPRHGFTVAAREAGFTLWRRALP